MMNFPHLLNPASLHGLQLANRIVMAPMTRSRASAEGIPSPSAAVYYAQRASAGLIISEATNISDEAIGSPLTPGLYTQPQVESWKKVTEAVHAAGGRIYAQLWHAGRVGHSLVRGGKLPLAPSAIAIQGQQHFTGLGMADYETPQAMTLTDIQVTLADYGRAAANAKMAGFDGVELHSAFGYLPNQFLSDSSNQRTDQYGGSIENRCRFVLEAMQALVAEWGADRVGIRLSPSSPFNSMADSDPKALFSVLLVALDRLKPGYVHLMRPGFPLDDLPHWPRDVLAAYRPFINSPVVANGGYDAASAEADLQAGRADFISFGTAFIANPDLPARFASGAALAEADRATFYGGGDHGYVDYPALTD